VDSVGALSLVATPQKGIIFVLRALKVPGSHQSQWNRGIEFKRQDAPKISRSMREAVKDLKLNELLIVYPGTREYKLEANITLKPLGSLSA
jgi:hypothetical protein